MDPTKLLTDLQTAITESVKFRKELSDAQLVVSTKSEAYNKSLIKSKDLRQQLNSALDEQLPDSNPDSRVKISG